MIVFEKVNEQLLGLLKEIINSNPVYNRLENGHEQRTMEEIRKEYLHQDHNRETCLIKVNENYIGVIDYMIHNPKDKTPWLGLLLLHGDYQGYGFGKRAFKHYELKMKALGLEKVRLGILTENLNARSMWEKLGFRYLKTVNVEQSAVDCYEKLIY
ncbi:GNAT family N-acetyltransferase [Pseudalkalibacillus caeni]|uniref:GNAT family N-acetyltransferase n=1 Tax=Exobacillus caeni TaxID=2574798 RepID=A0A5R9F500_9BACL|nr:GNAT family N-acetyltransferase [Pseudalkalibacillus caeni]TLS37559.1 GNAT family N-acetyltransferase [Pseudalkalibacillus caeni]